MFPTSLEYHSVKVSKFRYKIINKSVSILEIKKKKSIKYLTRCKQNLRL